MGHLLEVVVHAANIHDTKAACMVLEKVKEKYETIKAFLGDAGYRKTAVEYVENKLKLEMHISERIKDEFAILPLRWIVERTLGWIGNDRRLSKDYERHASTEESMIKISMMRRSLKNCV